MSILSKKRDSLKELPSFPPASTIENKEPPPSLLATITQSIGLKFSNGYRFTISLENGKMIFSATMNGQEAFYLDEIPQEFIDSLRRMLTT